MVTKKTLQTIKESYLSECHNFPPMCGKERFALRCIMFDVIGNDMINTPMFDLVSAFSLACYDRNGKGYDGIVYEVKKRLQFAKDIGVNELPLTDFFKHTTDQYDIFDIDNEEGIEIKTGCGNWLYSQYRDLDKIRQEKEQSEERILWRYHYQKKKDNEFSFTIYINTTWVYFFRYLDTYERGYKSFFKYNPTQSIKSGCNVYEMNTLKTSKKKVRFLRAFKEID